MDNKKVISAVPESYRTSDLTPIILSETEHVQISFCGKQVDNHSNMKKNIKGKLVVKKKNKDINSFDNIEKFSKKDLKSSQYVEIALNTSETYELGKGLMNYFQLFSGKRTNPYEEIQYVKKDKKIDILKQILEKDDNLLNLIKDIDTESLNAALNIKNLHTIRQTMADNINNDGENAFWQPFFEKNAWVLSQLFHAPVMFYEGKRYVGGKGINNHGGQITDFIYKNDITDNVAIIEIKSPVKKIVQGEYRQTYIFDSELIGAVNQLLLQKDSFQKNYHSLFYNSCEKFKLNNIDAVLVYGNVSTLSEKEKEAFENYRNELRSIRIVGFDELLLQIENLLKLFENRMNKD